MKLWGPRCGHPIRWVFCGQRTAHTTQSEDSRLQERELSELGPPELTLVVLEADRRMVIIQDISLLRNSISQ